MLDFALSAFVTLLLVVDPVGLAPAFLAATGGMPDKVKRTIALRAPLIAASIPAPPARDRHPRLPDRRRTAAVRGFLPDDLRRPSASRGARGRQGDLGACLRRRGVSAGHPDDGRSRRDRDYSAADGDAGYGAKLAIIIAVVVSVCLLCMLCFVSASLIVRTLGRTGNAVLSRVLGMLLAAYSVQFVINGIAAVRASFS